MTRSHARGRATAICVVALLACLVVLATPAGPAGAHEVDPDVRYVIEDVAPVLPDGVAVVVVRGIAPQVVVDVTGDGVLEALDGDGRPFVRIGPDGVEADLASYAFIDTADPAGIPPGVEVPRDLEPRWQMIREDPSWGWFDHRLHEDDLRFTAPVEGTVVLERWELDFRYDGDPFTVTGRTERAPVEGATVAALTSGNTPLPGVTVQLLTGSTPGLFVTASEPVTVLGEDGEPFLRIGPDGVEANERSPTWLLSGRAAEDGTDPAELDLDATDEPSWLAVSEGSSFGWLDPRATAPDQLPAGSDPTSGAVTLTSWDVPLVAEDGTEAQVSGETRYVALPDPPTPTRWWPAAASGAAGAALLGAGVWLRRRRA